MNQSPVVNGADGLAVMFRPRSVAVVGASRSSGKLGAAMARSLEAFGGPVALINANIADQTGGWYGSMAHARDSMGAAVDLALLCIPAAACPDALSQAADAGCRAAVICSGGFAEAGGAGVEYQQQVVSVARANGVRLLGPNTSGFLSPRHIFASFMPSVRTIPAGPVAIVAASGGMNHALAFGLAAGGSGVSLAVGLGLGADVSQTDVLRYLVTDEETAVVGLCIEAVDDGLALMDAIRKLVPAKPVVALAVGQSDVSAFAATHTGALATSWRVLRAALRQAGAVLVDDDQQMVDALITLSKTRLGPGRPRGVGVVTAQAGPGLLLTDQLRVRGAELPVISPKGEERLGRLLSDLTFRRNPVDTGRPSGKFGQVVRAVAEEDGMGVLVIYAIAETEGIDLPGQLRSAEIGDRCATVLATGGPDADIGQIRKNVEDLGIPLVVGPKAAVNAVTALLEDQCRREHLAGRAEMPELALDEVLVWRARDEAGAKALLDGLGFSTPRRRVCDSKASALAAFAELGKPLAAKILGAGIQHKTELGGVHLRLSDQGAFEDAIDQLSAIGASSFLIEEMAADGIDLILSARRDPTFGVSVMIGLGGTAAEAVDDVVIRIAPMSRTDAVEITDELAAHEVLHGWRGGPVLDRSELAALLLSLAAVLMRYPALSMLEVNPLRLCAHGLVALDAVIDWSP